MRFQSSRLAIFFGLLCLLTAPAALADTVLSVTGSANAGLPLAILGDDGKLYIPLGQDAGKPPTDLKAHVDHKVTVKGRVVTSSGASGIVISSVSM